MQERIFVVSDLHLGGAPGEAGAPGFQMCPAASRKRLAEFFSWVAAQRTDGRDIRLVLAGDIVDFLAEEDPRADTGYRAFTADERTALEKLERIFSRTVEVWDALALAVKSGLKLSLMVGNHDVELALPALRRALVERLGGTPHEFLFNGEALPIGPVLIEHGNRYDPWNQIDHDTLRALSSEQSRREPSERSLTTPGSELVVSVMNGLKKTYAFVDLLKPETDAVLPLLAVLDPARIAGLEISAGMLARRTRNAIRTDPEGKPRDGRNIGAADGRASNAETSAASEIQNADLSVARELAGLNAADDGDRDRRQIGARDQLLGLVDGWRVATSAGAREALTDRLLRALRWWNRADTSFQVDREDETYLESARASVRRGFKVVVYGHTHMAKRIDLDGGARYLNTGTWADLMRLPEGLSSDEATARATLAGFANDLARNDVSKYREQHPTFAQIDIGPGDRVAADVFWFWAAGKVEALPKGLLPRRASDEC